MAQTLDEFVAQEAERLRRFAEYWRESNRKDPDNFPMRLEDDGLWGEQLDFFDPFDQEQGAGDEDK